MEDEWIPLQHSKAEEIIGLSYENFKRTIIIPQGQFKEFIELGAKDRTQMMKEIFNLHHFDLQEKVSKLNNKNLTALNQDRKSTRLNSSHVKSSYAVFCLKKKRTRRAR